MIDQFTLQEFEQALDSIIPLGWLPLGMDLNEYCYIIEVNSNARIHIRSSIGESGITDEAGQDSIRLNLEIWQPDFRRNEHYDWIALPKKAIDSQRWITRVPGWQERLEEKIRLYWNIAKEFRQPVEFCSCGKAPFVGISKSKKNNGRPYSSCLEKHGGCGLFLWLDEPLEGKVEFDAIQASTEVNSRSPANPMAHPRRDGAESNLQSDESNTVGAGEHGTSNANQVKQSEQLDLSCLSQESQEARIIGGVENDSISLQSANEAISLGGEKSTRAEESVQDANSQSESSLPDDNPERDTNRECVPSLSENEQEIIEELDWNTSQKKEPNLKQLEAITAPIDANVRVLAPPGSGKTFVIEQRYKYLIDNGVNPDNILAVTFSNKMAAAMATRILDTCSRANIEQICTIHAFCLRLLTKWDKRGDYYGWKVAGGTDSPVKSWEIKKWLDDFITDEWGEYEEKPGYQEVLNWIDISKYHGFSANNDCLEWFINTLGLLYGKRVYNIRKRFDSALYQRKCMTFADMLLLTELKLREDFAFRVWCQDKFNHVIIDEAHDTNYQAMRILVTISMEIGRNSIYEREELEK